MFRILSALSAPYADALRVFMPSWIKNSGAAEIRVRLLDPPPATHRLYMLRRWDVLTDEVRAARVDNVPLAWLDADCFVIRDLRPAFDGRHALAVARWPRVNCGAMFFDPRPPGFRWAQWLAETGWEIHKTLKPPSPDGACDQWAIERKLWEVEPHVRKLDWRVWNFCDGDDWPRELATARDTVRVVHVKGLGEWEGDFCQKRIAAVRELFGDRI